MTTTPIDQIGHRPWPLPRTPWVMRQVWESLAFLHWPVPTKQLRTLIHSGVDLDTFEGDTWIGIVPFRIGSIRLRGCPLVPGIHRFLELNVRTYVTRDGRPGVWFLSLDATSPLAVRVARWWYRLPYFNGACPVNS